MQKHNCPQCGKEIDKKHKKYCSHECYSKTLIGIPVKGRIKIWTPEMRNKMSEKKKGQKMNELQIKKLSNSLKDFYSTHTVWNKGIPHTKEQIEKMKGHIPWNKGKPMIHSGSFKKGKKHPYFNNWSSYKPYTKEFNKKLKELIKERDNFECFICKKKGNSIHHIDYNKNNSNPNNLITLCNSCHMKTNFDRKNWIKFFKKYGTK